MISETRNSTTVYGTYSNMKRNDLPSVVRGLMTCEDSEEPKHRAFSTHHAQALYRIDILTIVSITPPSFKEVCFTVCATMLMNTSKGSHVRVQKESLQ